ncbi:hypothetical protein ABW21_db0204966 [Orbilia brochopaga]|nr:hypothetical protein ABW21_db0204966 [Drechslerella brochopaga]
MATHITGVAQLSYKTLAAGSYRTNDTAVCHYPETTEPLPIILSAEEDHNGTISLKLSFTNWTQCRCELTIPISKVILNMLWNDVVYVSNYQENPAIHWKFKVFDEDGNWYNISTEPDSDDLQNGIIEHPPRIVSRSPVNLMEVVSQLIILRECVNSPSEQREFFTGLCRHGLIMPQAHLGWPKESGESSSSGPSPSTPPPPRAVPMLITTPPRSNEDYTMHTSSNHSTPHPIDTAKTEAADSAVGVAEDRDIIHRQGELQTPIDLGLLSIPEQTRWKWISTAQAADLDPHAQTHTGLLTRAVSLLHEADVVPAHDSGVSGHLLHGIASIVSLLSTATTNRQVLHPPATFCQTQGTLTKEEEEELEADIEATTPMIATAIDLLQTQGPPSTEHELEVESDTDAR